MQNKRVLFIIPKNKQFENLEELANNIDTHIDIENDEKNGYEALKRGGYDLVVSSLFASELNGYELLSKIKKDKIDCGVIFLIKDYNDREKLKLIDQGVFSFIKKSKDEEDLPKQIKKYFKEKKSLNSNKTRFLETKVYDLEEKSFELEQTLINKTKELDYLKKRSQEIVKENKEIRASLEQKKKFLINSERMISIGQMTASIVHEINNPLTVVTSLASLISMNGKDDPKLMKYSKLLSENIDKLRLLTYSILSFGNPKRGERAENVNFNLAIDEVLAFYEYEIRKNDSELIKDYQADLPKVKIPKIKFQQIVINILKNSVFAVKKNEGVIKIKTYVDDGLVAVKIEDNGKGIKKSEIPDIFEPFFTTKSKKEGSGLGLYICKEIVDMYKGDISVKSAINKGTSITFRLPATKK